MDPLTHALSGAVLARAVPKEPLTRGRFWLLVLLTMAPDADFVLKFISDAVYLQYHRGITHSILMLPLWIWFLRALVLRDSLSPWLIGAALALHIGLDLITSFGTMILAPFSDWRAAIDLVFIIDPLFTACLLLPLMLMPLLRRQRRILAMMSLALTLGYLLMTAYLHHQAMALARTSFADAAAWHALPMPFSPANWQIIVSYPDHYRRASVNLWPAFPGTMDLFPDAITAPYRRHIRPTDQLRWQRLPRMQAIKLADGLPGVDFYRWFARFPVLLEADASHDEFGDLRFGAGIPGLDSPFRLHVERGPNPRAWLIWRGEAKTPLR